MRRRFIGIILILGFGGCSRAFVEVIPPSAKLIVNGRVAGIGKATIPTQPGNVVLVRAEQEGFRQACALVEHRGDTVLRLARANPEEAPLPSDAEILQAWETQRANLCADYATQAAPATVIVTAGDLSRPYDILGEVQIDTTEESSGGAVFKDAFLRGAIAADIRPTLKGDTAEMYEALRSVALAQHGAKVDAIINVNVSEVDHDVFVRGVAVHFVERETQAKKRTVSDRLDELDRLGRSGMITPEEYRARRKAILEDL